jgi:cyclopropane fatty-acyl-phospholipid synthase-like methyltransferase
VLQVKEKPGLASSATVVGCYAIFDRVFPRSGLFDLTEGIYGGDPNTTHEQAQANQHHYLLDQLRCDPGSRILDVGCGYGTLLKRAQERGLKAIGITLSPEQVRLGQQHGLDIRLRDYKAISSEWDQTFDGVVANGSLEHFVQPSDAVAGRADDIYRRFFRTMHRILNPASPARLVTTAIHFVRRPDPADLLRNPFAFPRGSDNRHWALLARTYGGWYPVRGQLEHCAKGSFKLTEEVDGTADYRRTSEEWLQRVKQVFRSKASLRTLFEGLSLLLRYPLQFPTALLCVLGTESWNWQFRPPLPPTQLLRHTWDYCPTGATGTKGGTYVVPQSHRSRLAAGLETLPVR